MVAFGLFQTMINTAILQAFSSSGSTTPGRVEMLNLSSLSTSHAIAVQSSLGLAQIRALKSRVHRQTQTRPASLLNNTAVPDISEGTLVDLQIMGNKPEVLADLELLSAQPPRSPSS